jgi:hypothetical protein
VNVTPLSWYAVAQLVIVVSSVAEQHKFYPVPCSVGFATLLESYSGDVAVQGMWWLIQIRA